MLFLKRYASGSELRPQLVDDVAESSVSELIKGILAVMKLDSPQTHNYIALGLRHHFGLALKNERIGDGFREYEFGPIDQCAA